MSENSIPNSQPPHQTPQTPKGLELGLIVLIVAVGSVLLAGLFYLVSTTAKPTNSNKNNPVSSKTDFKRPNTLPNENSKNKQPFCEQYGTFEVSGQNLSLEKYNSDDLEGVTSFIKARGNITFNEDKPMFGVSAPNLSTGPFIISSSIREEVDQIKEGDCVEVVYGSRGYDPNKVVFEVNLQ